jgi:hypothetical protein
MARDRANGSPEILPPPVAAGWPRPPGAPALVTERDVARARAVPGAVEAARGMATRIADGRFAFFGYPEVRLPEVPDWHRDPISGTRWPERHWSRVDHRVADADPKWLWELGRHQHVVHLARAHRLTGDPRFAHAAARHLDTFLDQNPPGIGIHWRVGLELGMRLTSWAWIVEMLRGSPAATPELGGRLLASVAAHLAQLERYPSLHSSANNHRIGELAGLVVGGLAFPDAPDAAGRAARGLDGLRHELSRQVHPDGVNAEQATAYQGFALDLVLPAVACLTRLGRPVPEEVAAAVGGMAAVLAYWATDAGTLPHIGDDDDAAGVDLSSEPTRPERLRARIRSTGLLLGRELPRAEPGMDETTAWLCGPLADAPPRAARRPGSAVLPHGGYAVLRQRDADDREVRAILKAGPFGLGPLHAHGHADLLSLHVAVWGEEAVVDAGTFTYYGDPEMRAYAQSTAAHSTVRVDGREQAEPLGPFIWRRPPRAYLGPAQLDGEAIEASGYHDAYAPVRHERRVRMRGGELEVVDRLSGDAGTHEAELRWQLAPGRVAEEEGGWRWSGARAGLLVAVEGLGPARVLKGRERPPAGFVSTRLEHWEPAPMIVAAARLTLPAEVVTRLSPRGPVDP